MKILWVSNASRVPTGYGNQTNLFTRLLKANGHEVTIFAFYGIEGAPLVDENGIINLPRLQHPYGNDIIETHFEYCAADIVVTLIDPFAMDLNVYSKLPWVAIAPIDSEPMHPGNAQALSQARWIWAISKFGESQIASIGLADKTAYVPHGVDTEQFKPGDRDLARKKIGDVFRTNLAGRFLVMLNAANKGQPSRKGFYEALAAYKIFSDSHPDALLYLHTEISGMWMGENIPTIMQMIGLDRSRVLFAPQYQLITGMLPSNYLNDAYNAADVFFQPSHGEGFGIPILEAQSAGCPVIVTDFSAMPELCFSGWLVPGIPFMAYPGLTQRLPLVPTLVSALETAYNERGNVDLRTAAREKALAYDHRIVYEQYMRPALDRIASDLTPKPAIVRKKVKYAGRRS